MKPENENLSTDELPKEFVDAFKEKESSIVSEKTTQELINDLEREMPGGHVEKNEALASFSEDISISQEELEHLKNTIPTLNFIELSAMERDIELMRINLDETKTAALNFCELEENTDHELTNAINKANAETEFTKRTKMEAEEFIEEYNTTIAAIDEIAECVLKAKEKFEDVDKTSSFMNSCMLDMLQKRIDELGEVSKNDSVEKRNSRRDLIRTKEIFSERESTEWLKKKFEELKPTIIRLTRDMKNDPKGVKIAGIRRAVVQTFIQSHQPEQMGLVEQYLQRVIGEENSFIFQYALYSVYLREMNRKRVDYKYIDAFIMNATDIESGIYDLEGGEETFISRTKELSAIIEGFVPTNLNH